MSQLLAIGLIVYTFVIADVADDMAACCDGKFSLIAGEKEAGIAAYPRRHLG